MAYEAKKYDHLLGMEGFSDNLLKNHFTLYEGYVANTNKAVDLLHKLFEEDKTSTTEFTEMKRRFAWEFNGMRLHELYFENMTKDSQKFDNDTALGKQMVKDYGEKRAGREFAETGAMRGIGWVITAYDPVGKKLFNVWINEHDVGHLAGSVPLVVMDVFEHAYMTDYGLKRMDYIHAFKKVVDWDVVYKRFDEALK